MKRLFPLYSILCLLLIGIGCSKDDSTPTDNQTTTPVLILNSTATDITVGDEIQFTTRSTKELINDAKITELSKGIVLSSNKWKAMEAGTFTFKATREGYKESEVVTVHVKEKQRATGSGIFSYAGKKYRIETAKLIFRSIESVEQKAIWNLELYNYTDDIGINFRFYTPTKIVADNKVEAVLPTGDNLEYLTLGVMKNLKDDKPLIEALAFKDIELDIKIYVQSSGYDKLKVDCVAPDVSGSPFVLSYLGELETIGQK